MLMPRSAATRIQAIRGEAEKPLAATQGWRVEKYAKCQFTSNSVRFRGGHNEHSHIKGPRGDRPYGGYLLRFIRDGSGKRIPIPLSRAEILSDQRQRVYNV
jgi:hypothetical protein